MSDFLENDRRHVWHPFTQMREWMAGPPVAIVEAEGALLKDSAGRVYLDGNASIWTNLHGHRRPELDAALLGQLGKVAHTSFLGLTNDVAPAYARELLEAMFGEPESWHVFFSDDGSTAIEAGLKMMHQARRQRGEEQRTTYLSLAAGYHGDTVGAMSLGHSAIFHQAYRGLMFPAREVASPACYRCPYNRAEPERGTDARDGRQCDWECVGEAARALDEVGAAASGFVLEPRVQGAAGMTMQAPGYVSQVAALCQERGVWLMADEVMTGFGRTGALFATQLEGVQPEVVALGKGITGGYLPLGATVASGEIFEAFLGEHEEFKTFFHGHSYSGNQLGCALARASLRLLREVHTVDHVRARARVLRALAQRFWAHPQVGDVRCEGLICAIELVRDFTTRERYPLGARIGFRVCEAARSHGLITRNIGDVLVLMPPFCITDEQLAEAVEGLWQGLCDVLPFAP